MPLDLLVVSNVWPPHFIGGYELGAADLVAGLERRGHRVTVLTSTYGVPTPRRDGNVHRLLFEEIHFRPLGLAATLAATLASARALPRVRRFLGRARFTVVCLFNPLGLNATVVQRICDSGPPVVAYVSDDWVARWPTCDRLLAKWWLPRPHLARSQQLALRALRRLLTRLHVLTPEPDRLPIRHALFVSRFVRDISRARLPSLATADIIPWGIDATRFPFRARRAAELENWTYVGQIERHKGLETAVEAVKLLRARGEAVRLTLHGHDTGGFAGQLKERVECEGLSQWVTFAGRRPRERVWQEAYEPGGLFVLPSTWDEPFPIALLEAFASGVPVLTTATGGTGELAREGQTATVFRAGDAGHLVERYLELLRAPERAAAIARRARSIVDRYLRLETMVERVEARLIAVAEGRAGAVDDPDGQEIHPWERAAPEEPSPAAVG